jgi:hypothetical protein
MVTELELSLTQEDGKWLRIKGFRNPELHSFCPDRGEWLYVTK